MTIPNDSNDVCLNYFTKLTNLTLIGLNINDF